MTYNTQSTFLTSIYLLFQSGLIRPMAVPFPDPAVLAELSRVFELILNPLDDTDLYIQRWKSGFRFDDDPNLWLKYLITYFANRENSEPTRSVAAIMLYAALEKRPREAQRLFLPTYLSLHIDIRDTLRAAAVDSLQRSRNSEHLVQVANLLGLFFALELSSACPREPFVPAFVESFECLIKGAGDGDTAQRCAVLRLIQFFAIHSVELRDNCAHDQPFMTLSPQLFRVLISGMEDFGCPPVQLQALEAMRQSLLIFKRTFSFPQASTRLVQLTARIIAEGDPVFLPAAYSVLRRCIDYFYPHMEEHMDNVRATTFADLDSGIPQRQVEACFLWSTVGEVESDILCDDKRLVKRKHRDFDHCCEYAAAGFAALFDRLVGLVGRIDARQTDVLIDTDYGPSHAAFACLSCLARAAGEPAVAPIVRYVLANGSSEDWRLRYTATLLLNAASQLPSFIDMPKNLLFAFDFFVRTIRDPMPPIADAAMWSLGRMIEETPDLATNLERFDAVYDSVTQKLDISDELTSRGCWLLSHCFAAFQFDDATSPLIQRFDTLADLLLHASDSFGTNTQEAAMGAISRLIERTPRTMTDEYGRLFWKLTAKLGSLLQLEPSARQQPRCFDLIVELLALIQAIVMNIGNHITSKTRDLMPILIGALRVDPQLTAEVLPAMGAVARAMKSGFAVYLPNLLEQVFDFLASDDLLRPAAVFISDIACSIEGLDVTRFVEILCGAAHRAESLTFETRLAVFTALGGLARYVGPGCVAWLDSYLGPLEKEAKQVLVGDDETIGPEHAKAFAMVCLQVYQALVPVLALVERGDRRIRSFFHIFDQLIRMDFLHEFVIPDCVVLIRLIADTFQRKMNVFLNRPAVIELLRGALESENEQLAELADATLQIVRKF
jgi:hypothetical protein